MFVVLLCQMDHFDDKKDFFAKKHRVKDLACIIGIKHPFQFDFVLVLMEV